MAINRSQFVTGTAANVSSLSAVFSSAVTAGSAIIVVHTRWDNSLSLFSTLVDNKNTAGFARRVWSTLATGTDTAVQLFIHDKLGISSGAAGSTYRVEIRNSSDVGGTFFSQISFCALEYTGGPWVFGSTASANGTSTGPLPGSLSASSTPQLFVSGAVHNTSGTLFVSTTVGQAAHVTTVDAANTNQVLNIVQSTGSSLAQNLLHSMNVSTRWLAGGAVWTAQGAGGAAARPFVDSFPMFGCV